jgi:hypothetical protein
MSIRASGWDQAPGFGINRDWPVLDAFVTIALHRDQWELVLPQLVTSERLIAQIEDQEELDLKRDAQ